MNERFIDKECFEEGLKLKIALYGSIEIMEILAC